MASCSDVISKKVVRGEDGEESWIFLGHERLSSLTGRADNEQSIITRRAGMKSVMKVLGMMGLCRLTPTFEVDVELESACLNYPLSESSAVA